MLFVCYLRKGLIYIPTVGEVDKGPYRYIEPIAVVPVFDTARLHDAFQETIARANPVVPNLLRADLPPPVLPKYAGVKSYSVFARGSAMWMIRQEQGTYQIIQQRKLPLGGWVDNPDQTITFPAGSSADDMIDGMIAIIQEAAAR